MRSVLDYIECPNCKHEASDEFNLKTGEEYVHCGNCGYQKVVTIINKDKKLSELTEEDWEIDELKNPYGFYRIQVFNRFSTQCGSFENEEQYNELKKAIEDDMQVEFCSVSRLIDGKIVTEMIKTTTKQ